MKEAIKIFTGSDFRLIVYADGFVMEVDVPDTAQVETYEHWEDDIESDIEAMDKAGFFKWVSYVLKKVFRIRIGL